MKVILIILVSVLRLYGRITGKSPRCVDGRKAIAYVEWDGINWIVAKRGEEASLEHGPQFLGAALMFVKVLQEIAGMTLIEAFVIVEKAFSIIGIVPQIHIDDHHGKYDFLSSDNDEIIRIVKEDYVFGCGFAAYAWGDDAEMVLRMAFSRHWRIQILTGEHEESGASRNIQMNHTFMTTEAVDAGKTQFNIDEAEAKLMFIVIALVAELPSSFVGDAMDWMIKTYADVVITLGGVTSAEEITINS